MADQVTITLSPPDDAVPALRVETAGRLSTILSKMLRNNPEWSIEDPLGMRHSLLFRVTHPQSGFARNLYYESKDDEYYRFADNDPHFYKVP